MPALTPEELVDAMNRNTRALEEVGRQLNDLRIALAPLRELGDKIGKIGSLASLFGRK